MKRSTRWGVFVLVTVVTGLDIGVKALRLRQTSERSAMKRARSAERAAQREAQRTAQKEARKEAQGEARREPQGPAPRR